MTTSDIIIFVSLIIAIIAILNEKNRKHILLKFHIIEYILFVVVFLSINYFVFYQSFFTRGIVIKSFYFQEFGIGHPENYAYLITILSLLYFFYKILFSFYPYNNIRKVEKFYLQLIEINDTSFLLDLIERYHKMDIIKLLRPTIDFELNKGSLEDFTAEDYYERNSAKEIFVRRVNSIVAFTMPFSWINRRTYAELVLHNVMSNPAFILLTSNQRPYLFSEVYSYFKKDTEHPFPDELLNSFLSELLAQKNFWLRKELRESKNHDNGQPDIFFDNNKIIATLLKDLSVSEINEVWRPFGEASVAEIEEERLKGFESKMFEPFRDDVFLWDFKTYFTIQFFKILIIEAIVRKHVSTHFWLYYYRSITEAILKTFEKFPPKSMEESGTIYHKFIEIIIDNLFHWIELSNTNNDKVFYNYSLDCLGFIIQYLCESQHVPEEMKIRTIKNLLSDYCRFTNENEVNVQTKIGDVLKQPSLLTKYDDKYYKYVKIAWDKFDKLPHRAYDTGKEYEYFKKLKKEVIQKLGLDPNIL